MATRRFPRPAPAGRVAPPQSRPLPWAPVFVAAAVAMLLSASPASAQGGDGASATGVTPGATIRITTTEGATFDARCLDVRAGARFEVFGSDGKAFRIPVADVRRFTVTGRRETLRPAWSSERRPYDLYEIERIDGTVVVVAMVQWGMFALERDGRRMGDYRSRLRSFEVITAAAAPPASPAAVPPPDPPPSAPYPPEPDVFEFDDEPQPMATASGVPGGLRLLEITVMREGSGDLVAGALVLVTDPRHSFLDASGRDGVVSFAVPVTGGPWHIRVRTPKPGDESECAGVALPSETAGAPARVVVRLPGASARGPRRLP